MKVMSCHLPRQGLVSIVPLLSACMYKEACEPGSKPSVHRAMHPNCALHSIMRLLSTQGRGCMCLLSCLVMLADPFVLDTRQSKCAGSALAQPAATAAAAAPRQAAIPWTVSQVCPAVQLSLNACSSVLTEETARQRLAQRCLRVSSSQRQLVLAPSCHAAC